jgi:hypothetical protein
MNPTGGGAGVTMTGLRVFLPQSFAGCLLPQHFMSIMHQRMQALSLPVRHATWHMHQRPPTRPVQQQARDIPVVAADALKFQRTEFDEGHVRKVAVMQHVSARLKFRGDLASGVQEQAAKQPSGGQR